MIGISGVRGVVGDNLTPELLVRLGQAFGTYVDSGTVVVGRDTRVSGDMVKHAVFSGLLSAGCRIIDVGVCGTPSAAMMVPALRAAGGIVISASHNPIEWNALKFFRSDGVYLNAEQGRQLLDIYYGGDVRKVGYDRLHAVAMDNTAVERHLAKVLQLVDVRGLRRRRFRVALDCCNGAGSDLALRFLQHIGADVAPIHCEMNGLFPHDPEPTFEHIKDLLRVTRRQRCDIGFAQDADADRIAIVSEKGRYLGEEYTLCLATRYTLAHRRGPVVTNLSTTRMLDDVAQAAGVEVVRTPVGEVNVAERMREVNAVIGGEGNGGVIEPRVHLGRDALTGMALILQLMLETGKKISALAGELSRYYMVKERVECSKRVLGSVLKALADEPSAKVDMRDGVKLDFADSWVHVRASNTEPIVRVYTEARTRSRAREMAQKYKRLVERVVAREQ